MQPRILFRTHYQVDEPAYVAVLVKTCTSPIQSAYDETVAEKLRREVRAQSKEFNVAAAGYALDLARGLGVVNDQNVWTEKGHLLNLVVESRGGPWNNGLELAFPEKLLFFRLFLEADGAGLRFIATYLLKHGQIPRADEDWNALARDLFLDVYTEYLQLTGTTADRVTLRNEIDRIRARGYTGKSGSHKLFIHLQTLYRLGLVGRMETGGARVYQINQDDGRKLRVLLEEVPGARALEEIVRDHRWAEIAASVFGDGRQIGQIAEVELLRLLVPKYQAVVATGVPLCPLPTVVEAVQIELLARESGFATYKAALDMLQNTQKHRPSDIRFHVDRRGSPAFIKLSERFVAEYSQAGKAVGAS
jgi:hypothetical protein